MRDGMLNRASIEGATGNFYDVQSDRNLTAFPAHDREKSVAYDFRMTDGYLKNVCAPKRDAILYNWSHWQTPPDVGPPPTLPIMEIVTGCHSHRR